MDVPSLAPNPLPLSQHHNQVVQPCGQAYNLLTVIPEALWILHIAIQYPRSCLELKNMRSACALAVGGLLIGSAKAGSPVPGVVQWQIEKKASPISELLRKRADTYEEVITNERMRGGYFATCAIGTPYQNLTLQLDTGSSDTWVPDTTAEACQGTRSDPQGCAFGAFDPAKSSTFVDVGKGDFDISYVDGSHSRGDYFSDRFEIGGAVVNVTMGLGIDTDIAYGLVGVGYALNEANVSNTQSVSSAYPNLPVTMEQEGLINSIAYSLWLNDLGIDLHHP